MEKPELMKKLEAIFDDAARRKMWGTVEIEFRDGLPILIRKIETEKIQSTGNMTHAKRNSY